MIETLLRQWVDRALRVRGLQIVATDAIYERDYRSLGARIGNVDFAETDRAIMERARRYTLVSDERQNALIAAVRHVVSSDIPGAFVECGVWRGGSCMAAALTLKELDAERDIVMFDTFRGMPPGGEHDVDFAGNSFAVDNHASWEFHAESGTDVTAVRDALASTGYNMSRVRLVPGMVEDTIPGQAPAEIAILRLDTDWYKSTRHELEQLYPRVARGGILIIDDYGHLQGVRRAVDEYFAESPVFMARVDYTARLAVKP